MPTNLCVVTVYLWLAINERSQSSYAEAPPALLVPSLCTLRERRPVRAQSAYESAQQRRLAITSSPKALAACTILPSFLPPSLPRPPTVNSTSPAIFHARQSINPEPYSDIQSLCSSSRPLSTRHLHKGVLPRIPPAVAHRTKKSERKPRNTQRPPDR